MWCPDNAGLGRDRVMYLQLGHTNQYVLRPPTVHPSNRTFGLCLDPRNTLPDQHHAEYHEQHRHDAGIVVPKPDVPAFEHLRCPLAK
jgi:hypothetical protein